MLVIGAVAELTAIKIPTIRFHEQEGHLSATMGLESGSKDYGDRQMRLRGRGMAERCQRTA